MPISRSTRRSGGAAARSSRYAAALSQVYDNRVALEHDLQFALPNGELELEYQPIVDPRSGARSAARRCCAGTIPMRGRIPPSEFIPIAEATGLIVPIGAWVLDQACAEATHWSADVKVSVNLSPVQFRRGREIVDIVSTALGQLRPGAEPPRSRGHRDPC